MPKIITPKLASPYWQSRGGEYRLYHGNALDVLRGLPSRSVQMVCTSPPYWGLRDYDTAEWEGGSTECDHIARVGGPSITSSTSQGGTGGSGLFNGEKLLTISEQYKGQCSKCGAKRIDQQLGSEETPEEFISKLVEIFREVRRVLRMDGVVFLNLGDTYSGSKGNIIGDGVYSGKERRLDIRDQYNGMNSASVPSLGSGNLVGIPWRVALALQADGWILRQDVIWAKPNPMPESVENRCTKAHEYIFILTQGMKYYWDGEAIKDESVDPVGSAARYAAGNFGGAKNVALAEADKVGVGRGTSVIGNREFNGTANKRSVWTVEDEGVLYRWLVENHPELVGEFLRDSRIKDDVWRITTKGYPGAHYATFPPGLVRPCIRAGTSEYGACIKCGTPWYRVVEKAKTLGWSQGCNCKFKEGEEEVRPCIVLDPFIGSGTTLEVCIEEEHWGIGIDLSEEYLKSNAIPRVEGNLLCRPGLRHLVK